MDNLKLNYNSAIFRICADTPSAGKIFSQRLREPIEYSDLTNLLLIMDKIMEYQDYPRASQTGRTFSAVTTVLPCADSEDEMMREEDVAQAAGAHATLVINVITRQSATWQGFVTNDATEERHSFSSTLQLLTIIEPILNN